MYVHILLCNLINLKHYAIIFNEFLWNTNVFLFSVRLRYMEISLNNKKVSFLEFPGQIGGSQVGI